jgi:hypothetical protein
MTDMTLIPTGGMGGSDALAAGGGALLGSIFGNGLLGRGGLGGWGGEAGAVPVQNAIDTTAILTGINDLATQTGNLGMTLVQGQNTLGTSILQGQNSTNTTVERAAASTYTGLTAQNTQGLLANVQGFAGLGAAITAGNNAIVSTLNANEINNLTRSYDAQIAAAKCCCETNLNIERQANETRGLIRDQFAQSQATLICDLKSQLQASQFQNSQQHQTAIFTHQISELAQLVNFKIPTPPTPPTV